MRLTYLGYETYNTGTTPVCQANVYNAQYVYKQRQQKILENSRDIVLGPSLLSTYAR